MKSMLIKVIGIVAFGIFFQNVLNLSYWLSLIFSLVIVLSLIPFVNNFKNRKVKNVGAIQQIKSDKDGFKCWLLAIKAENWHPKMYKCYLEEDNKLGPIQIGTLIEAALNDTTFPNDSIGVLEGSQQNRFINRHTETGFGEHFTQYRGMYNLKEYFFDLEDA
ncbi:MAG: hypothetical protein ABJ004_07725 [Cyclobacteriaceae bacterium]